MLLEGKRVRLVRLTEKAVRDTATTLSDVRGLWIATLCSQGSGFLQPASPVSAAGADPGGEGSLSTQEKQR
jgi:hypothetical protein